MHVEKFKYLKIHRNTMEMRLNPLNISIFVISALVLSYLFLPLAMGGTSETKTATSNLTVNTYVSISLTTALSDGITFGALEPATNDNNATSCDAGLCNVSISADTNVVCHVKMKVDDELSLSTDGATEIANTGYTWNVNATETDLPDVTGSFAVEKDYDDTNLVMDAAGKGQATFWNAWIDIPSAQTAGVYNNTISFCGEADGGTAC